MNSLDSNDRSRTWTFTARRWVARGALAGMTVGVLVAGSGGAAQAATATSSSDSSTTTTTTTTTPVDGGHQASSRGWA